MITDLHTTPTHRIYLQDGDKFICRLGTFRFVKPDHCGRVHAEMLSDRTNTRRVWVNFGDDIKLFNVINRTQPCQNQQ
jgi:hypothetical protein